jgi:type IV pilus assembly protein PilV
MKNTHKLSSEAGFSMIEVLTSMLVMSIGLLAILGLFINGIKTTDAAYLHSQAVVLAHDMADRIRANPSVLDNYSLALAATMVAPGNDCFAQACSTLQLAEADLYDWKNQIDAALPKSDASVVTVASNTTITVTWEDHLGDAESYSVVTR